MVFPRKKLAGHLAQVYAKHIDPYNTVLTMQKAKLVKLKPSQSLKPFERCEYKIVDRPPTQLFKQKEEESIKNMKTLKKSNKISTNLKKRNLKTNKISNLYFDPEGDSVKRYRELYTFKHSPGIRTVTMIQEAVNIYNDILQKARAKKNYLGRRKKRREEMLDSLSLRKQSSDDVNLGIQRKIMKAIPSKDFLARNKLRKSKIGKSFESCDVITKAMTLSRLPLLPTQEFLNRNMPKKCNEDVYFSKDEYLLRIKSPNSSKKLLPVPVIKIGFQDESTNDLQSKKVHSKDTSLNNFYSSKYNFSDPFLHYKGNEAEKVNQLQYKGNDAKKGNQLQKNLSREDRIESYIENLTRSPYESEEEYMMRSSVSVINVGFQHAKKNYHSQYQIEKQISNKMPPINSPKKMVKKREEKSYLILKENTFSDRSVKSQSDSYDNLLGNRNLEKPILLDRIDYQWMRMRRSIENLKKTKYISKYMSNYLKDNLPDTGQSTSPDKMSLLINKQL